MPLRFVGPTEMEGRGRAAFYRRVQCPLPVGAHDDQDWDGFAGQAVDAGEQRVDPGPILVVHLFGGPGLGERVGFVDDQD